MRFEEVFQKESIQEIADYTAVGIDIGSRQAKAVLLHRGNVYTTLAPTGFFMQEVANELLSNLMSQAEIERSEIDYIVVTGYGRIALKFDDIRYRMVTEIACHGKGAHHLGDNVHTIVDIGGQDSKVIKINPKDGSVINFAMNDKCAAGTGTFLEKIAGILEMDVTEIGDVSLKADAPTKIDSTCVVFAESEVVSNRAKGETIENISAGIHKSVAKRVNGLLSKVGIESNVMFTGGVSNNIGMKKAIEDILGVKIAESKLDTVFAGALGAAVFATEFADKNLPTITLNEETVDKFKVDLTDFRIADQKAKEQFIHKSTDKKAYVGYTCVYTPIEVLAAANVSYIRLLHKGTPSEVIAGETLAQSILCDYIKSIVGAFIKKDPLTNSVEKLYSFNTCSCMRSAVESIGKMYVPSVVYNLPRKSDRPSYVSAYASEIKAFKEDLEDLTGEQISEEKLRESIKNYNLARKYLREIAEYRKENMPLISSSEYQELIRGYYTIPIESLLPELEKIKKQLQEAAVSDKKPIRLLLSGGIITEGDNKVTKILEELGVSIVAEDNCTGIKPVSFSVDEQSDRDVYEELAEAYIGKAPCSRMDPKENMLEYSLKLAQDYKVDGVVLYYLKFCPSYSLEEKLYQDMLDKYNIPLIILSGDYSIGDEGQLKTRLEAFVELLQQRLESK